MVNMFSHAGFMAAESMYKNGEELLTTIDHIVNHAQQAGWHWSLVELMNVC